MIISVAVIENEREMSCVNGVSDSSTRPRSHTLAIMVMHLISNLPQLIALLTTATVLPCAIIALSFTTTVMAVVIVTLMFQSHFLTVIRPIPLHIHASTSVAKFASDNKRNETTILLTSKQNYFIIYYWLRILWYCRNFPIEQKRNESRMEKERGTNSNLF